jgi:hypothetical protein
MRGWRRLGVVLSVVWFFGFGYWLRQADFDYARKVAGYEQCSAAYDMERDAPYFGDRIDDHVHQVIERYNDCNKRAGAFFVNMATPWWGILVMDALSVGALWALAWIVFAVGHWVTAGFRRQA